MAEVVIRVCDVDLQPAGEGEVVRHYQVSVEGHTYELDLCDKHAGPIAPLGNGEPRKSKPKPSRSRRKVTTLDEIEAMKHEHQS